jgi:aryl-alcohol dehydrogenase-like predicted oxidoreductase
MAIAPFGVLGQGKLRTDAEEEERAKSGENGRTVFGDWRRNESEIKVSRALEKIANEVGVKSITMIALAWVMQKVPHVFPIIGGRKVEHLHANIESLKITLTKQQIEELESVLPFDLGFPYNRFVSKRSYFIISKVIANLCLTQGSWSI